MDNNNMRMFMGMGGNKNSNSDGPIGFIDLPKTNDRFVQIDKSTFTGLLVTWSIFLAVFGVMFIWYALLTATLGSWLIPWLLLSFVTFYVTSMLTIGYASHYRGMQANERQYLHQYAAQFRQYNELGALYQEMVRAGRTTEEDTPTGSNTELSDDGESW